MIYLLDTNICIAVLTSRDPKLVNRIASHSPKNFCVCSIVRAELFYGARKSQRVSENLTALDAFLAPYSSAVFGDEAAKHYGTIRATLVAGGTPIGGNDFQIAAIALAEDLIIITRNYKDFQRVPALRVEMW